MASDERQQSFITCCLAEFGGMGRRENVEIQMPKRTAPLLFRWPDESFDYKGLRLASEMENTQSPRKLITRRETS